MSGMSSEWARTASSTLPLCGVPWAARSRKASRGVSGCARDFLRCLRQGCTSQRCAQDLTPVREVIVGFHGRVSLIIRSGRAPRRHPQPFEKTDVEQVLWCCLLWALYHYMAWGSIVWRGRAVEVVKSAVCYRTRHRAVASRGPALAPSVVRRNRLGWPGARSASGRAAVMRRPGSSRDEPGPGLGALFVPGYER